MVTFDLKYIILTILYTIPSGAIMKKTRIYHISGTPDFQMSIGIETAGKNMKTRDSIRYHRETEIVLQVAGTSTNEIDGKIITNQTGDIWIIPEGTPHRRVSYSDDSVLYWFLFTPDAIAMQPEHFFHRDFAKPLSEGRLEIPKLLQPGHPCYQAVHDAMIQGKNCPYYGKNYKQKRLLLLMQICLAIMPYCRIREDIPVIPDTAPEGVQLCMRYIQNRYHTKIRMEELANFCHIHPNRLTAVFKEHTGQSVFEYLTKFRIEAAGRLLKNEDLPVSKVAELVGFRSDCLFYRKFKEIMGMTPKAYAANQKNQ